MHIVITGAAGGIGRALSERFASPDTALTLVDRDAEALGALVEHLDTPATAMVVDLADLEHCADFLDAAEAEHGPVDVLISNAAIGYIEAAWTVAPERVETLFRVNVLAPMRLIHRILPAMRERGSGTVVCIGSVTGLMPPAFQAHYAASKAAIGAFCEALRSELLGTGVNVLTVYPGPIATDMDRRVKERLVPSKRLDQMKVGSPEGLADYVARSVASGRARIVYPRRYAIVRWFYAIAHWATVSFPIPLRSRR